jgi:hypothetical protein
MNIWLKKKCCFAAQLKERTAGRDSFNMTNAYFNKAET